MRYSIAAASLFSTSALAVLYPGQSNLNHTCQISECLESMPLQRAPANTVNPQPMTTPSFPAPVPPTQTPSTRVAPKHTEDSSSRLNSGLHTLDSSPRVNCCQPMTGRCMDCGQTSATVCDSYPATLTYADSFRRLVHPVLRPVSSIRQIALAQHHKLFAQRHRRPTVQGPQHRDPDRAFRQI